MVHLSTLLFPLLPLTTALLIPASLLDGFYLAPINATSPDSLERVDLDALVASPPTRHKPTPAVDRRQTPRVQYGIGPTGRTLSNHGDYNACTASWRTYWDSGAVVPPHKMLICTQGNAVLAACNYRSSDFSARGKNPPLVDYFNGVADGSWGSWTTGWVHFLYYDYLYIDFTFWRDTKGTQICGNL